jgi:predicted NBD/HSP70 family sugar kinase
VTVPGVSQPGARANGKTSSAVRVANRSAIVDVLRRRGLATRAELCELTGLSRATVSALVGELAARGLLVERAGGQARVGGRPPTVLTLDRSGGLGIGIDIGVRHLAVAVGDLSRTVHAERWWPEPAGHTAPDGIATVLNSVGTALREAGAERERLIGTAVSIAAPIYAADQTIAEPAVLPGWTGAQLADALADELRIPVAIDNDATLGALGETIWGTCAGARSLAYVKLASRIGVGLVLDGALYRGHAGLAGEFGHLTVDPDGPTCWCGSSGCLEMYAGGGAILRELPGYDDDNGGIEAMIDAALDGDVAVSAAVNTAARHLGRGVAALVNMLNPQHVVLGGELSRLAPLLLDPAREELTRYSFVARSCDVSMSTSSLGRRASLLGALALVLTQPSRFRDGTSPRTEGII